MIVEYVKDDRANLTMSKIEARVLHDALTIAKIHIGPVLLLGDHGKRAGVDIESMRRILAAIAES